MLPRSSVSVPMDSRSIIRLLEAEGWELARVKGDHHQFKHATRKGATTVQHPKKDIDIKNVVSIERQSGVKLRRR
jgi:predicted RNA binding protein YcfA (HicA-like mRNA interferase family)